MGQVPSAKPWLLIGSGRLATHLAFDLEQADIPVRQWSRALGWHDAPGASGAPRHGLGDLDKALAGFDRVLLAVADDALADVVARHRRAGGPPWIHFSGSRRIAEVWSAHPLCTFGPTLYEPAFYRRIPFVLEAEGPSLAGLLPGLDNPEVRIPGADKALYHALCVVAGNVTTLLWQELYRELEGRWEIPASFAEPFLERTAANLVAAGSRQALTGPIARGDVETIRANLGALDCAGLGRLARVYRAVLEGGAPGVEFAA